MFLLDLFINSKKNKSILDSGKQSFSTRKELLILQEMILVVLGNLDLEKVSQKIVDLMVKDLGAQGGILFLIDKEKKYCFPYTASNTFIIRQIIKTLKVPFREHKFFLSEKNNFIQRAITEKRIFTSNRFEDFITPVVDAKSAYWMQVFSGSKSSIVLPVIIREEVIGVLWVNFPFKGVTKNAENKIKIFANITAIAINNAQQYEQVQIQLKNLQEKTQDLQSLLSLSQVSSSGIEIKKSIQDILNIIPEKFGHLKILGAVLARYEESTSKVYAYAITESVLMQETIKLLSMPKLADYEVFLNKTDPGAYTLTSKSILNGEIYKSEKLADFICPPVKSAEAYLMQKSSGTEAIVSVPVNVRGQKLGALIFLFTKPMKDIGERELSMAKAFSEYLGVVLENFQFYGNLNKNIEELTRTKDNLEEILTMKNEFLRIVSHQLRTPLTAVRGLISMWKDGDFDNLASVKMIEVKTRVANNVERLNNVINDMIKAMEAEGDLKLKFTPTDIEELIKDSIEILRSNFERKGLYLKYKKLGEYIPEIEADKNSLSHVFMNLIDNAEKYTEKGGLEIAVYRQEDGVSVRFFDTGVGLSDEDKEALFKKFSRGQNSGRLNPGGSGLGLFIVKQILDEHHGKIEVSSLGKGKGTTFVVSLPIRQPKPSLG